jgi:RNA polymerase sigma-70 factor (ECF subfamily)
MDRTIAAVDRTQQPTADDAFLLSLVQAGEEQAMATLFDRYSKIVYSVALRVLSDQARAEDVLQDVFMQLWRTPDNFTAVGGSLGGWLAVLSRNRSVNALRRKHQADPMDAIHFAAPIDLSSEAERNGLAERTRTVLDQLPSEQRKVLEMAVFDGLTHIEIAEVTNEPVSAIKSTLRSALLTLRGACQP